MSNLLKTQRALDMCPEWIALLQTACEFEGVPYDRSMAVHITMGLADKMELLEDGLLSIDGITDADILEGVREYEPPPPPDTVAEVEVLKEQFTALNRNILNQLETLAAKVEVAEPRPELGEAEIIERPGLLSKG